MVPVVLLVPGMAILSDVPVCECGRCGKVWLPEEWAKARESGGGIEVALPARCARCKSRQWNAGSQAAKGEAKLSPEPQPRYTPAPSKTPESQRPVCTPDQPKLCPHGLAYHPGCTA